MGSEMKTSVLLGLFLLASLSLSRDVRLHLSLPEGSKLLSVDPGSETMTIDQDYSGSDPEKCKTDAECPGLYNICGNDGRCGPTNDDGFVSKIDQDYSGSKTCGGHSDCLPAGVCIKGECQILNDPDPPVLDGFMPRMSREDQDYGTECGGICDRRPAGVCINGECQDLIQICYKDRDCPWHSLCHELRCTSYWDLPPRRKYLTSREVYFH